VYIILRNVREVRPPSMDRLDVSTLVVLDDLGFRSLEASFVKQVCAKMRIDGELVQQALQLIKQYHAGVKRDSGEPYYLHPIAVAQILQLCAGPGYHLGKPYYTTPSIRHACLYLRFPCTLIQWYSGFRMGSRGWIVA